MGRENAGTGKARMIRIYLAGPEVFLPNATEIGEQKKRICEERGCVGVYPLDHELALDGLSGGCANAVQSFGAVNFDSILLTSANFIQWQSPNTVDGNGDSPVGNTLQIIDWVTSAEPGIDVYIYENWPDMAPFIAGETFPPSQAEFAAFNAYTLG